MLTGYGIVSESPPLPGMWLFAKSRGLMGRLALRIMLVLRMEPRGSTPAMLAKPMCIIGKRGDAPHRAIR